jgi:hypothetical protein
LKLTLTPLPLCPSRTELEGLCSIHLS